MQIIIEYFLQLNDLVIYFTPTNKTPLSDTSHIGQTLEIFFDYILHGYRPSVCGIPVSFEEN